MNFFKAIVDEFEKESRIAKEESKKEFLKRFKEENYMREENNMTNMKLGQGIVCKGEICKVVSIACTKYMVEDSQGNLDGWFEWVG